MAKKAKIVGCPCCKSPLKSLKGQMVGCDNGHKYKVSFEDGSLRRKLVLQRNTECCKKGEITIIEDDVSFV